MWFIIVYIPFDELIQIYYIQWEFATTLACSYIAVLIDFKASLICWLCSIPGIWLTQINCKEASIVEAPGGCAQYFFGKDGLIKSFNFEGVQYLAGQNYKMCIRAEQGACYVGFQADANHFMLQVSLYTVPEIRSQYLSQAVLASLG